MSPPDHISPISPYAPAKPVVSYRKAPQEREKHQEDNSERPPEDRKPTSQPEGKEQDKSGPGVDRYA